MMPMELAQNVAYQRRCREGLTPKKVVDQSVAQEQQQLNALHIEIGQELENRAKESLGILSSLAQQLKEQDPTLAARTHIDNLKQSVGELQENKTALGKVMEMAAAHFVQTRQRHEALQQQLLYVKNAKRSQPNPLGEFIEGVSTRACSVIAHNNQGN